MEKKEIPDFCYLEFDRNNVAHNCRFNYIPPILGESCVKYIREDLNLSEKDAFEYSQMKQRLNEKIEAAEMLESTYMERIQTIKDACDKKIDRITRDVRQREKDIEIENKRIAKVRMDAYGQARQWNNAILKKFNFMIAKARKSKNLFARFIGWRIWDKMKWEWVAEKIKKEYGKEF